MNIELLTEKNQLQGTMYYEFALGPHTGSHWTSGSVFIHYEVFRLIEGVVSQSVNGFNPYGPTTMSQGRISELSAALKDFGHRVGKADAPEEVYGPLWTQIDEAVSERPWATLKNDITRLTGELRRWLDIKASAGNQITILGI